jgi:type IV fimbrial biogenesis protein FimT
LHSHPGDAIDHKGPTIMSRQRTTVPADAFHARGFTLVELIVTLVIGAIVLAVGAPSLQGMLAKYRIDGQHTGLMDDLLLAREEARNGGAPTAVCSSNNGSSCTGSAWAAGHIVFRDGGDAGTVDGSDKVLRYAQAAPKEVLISATLQASGAAYDKTYIHFDADGKADSSGTLLFTTCAPGQLPKLLTLQRNGFMTGVTGTAPC